MEKQFAVIYFPKENIYSEVPSAWLTSDKNQCWWPNSINARSLMVRCVLPDKDTWNLHGIKLESYSSTLESARKKAENPDYLTGGDEDLVTEKRNRKSLVRSSSDSESDLTPPPSPRMRKKKASKKAIERIECIVKGKETFAQANEPYRVLASYGDTNAQSIIELDGFYSELKNANDSKVETQSIMQNDSCSCKCKGNDTLKDTLIAVEKLSIVCSSIQKYVLSINNMVKAITSEQASLVIDKVLANISNLLPLKSIEDIAKFEEISQKDDTNRAYVQYIKKIGGRDFKDHMNRCLPKLFTNEVGKECSYLGLRGNFKLQQFHFIKTFVDVIMIQHSCSLHDVEKCMGEWFRLSNQRQKRVEKNKNK